MEKKYNEKRINTKKTTILFDKDTYEKIEYLKRNNGKFQHEIIKDAIDLFYLLQSQKKD